LEVAGAGAPPVSAATGETPNATFATPACFIRSITRMTRPCGTCASALMTARISGFFACASRASGRIASSLGTRLESTTVSPAVDSSTEKTVCCSEPVAALGRSMGSVCVTMIFAVTMKMIRSTSVTSTSGVTLMPEISSSSPDGPPPATR